jgi:hypothetical protein
MKNDMVHVCPRVMFSKNDPNNINKSKSSNITTDTIAMAIQLIQKLLIQKKDVNCLQSVK